MNEHIIIIIIIKLMFYETMGHYRHLQTDLGTTPIQLHVDLISHLPYLRGTLGLQYKRGREGSKRDELGVYVNQIKILYGCTLWQPTLYGREPVISEVRRRSQALVSDTFYKIK